MNPRFQLTLLTVLQVSLIIVGLLVFVSIKQCYQRTIIIPNLISALKDDVTGKEKIQPTSPRVMLPWLALPVVLILGRNTASIFFRAGRKKRQIKRDIKASLLMDRLKLGRKEHFSLYLRSFSQEESLKRKKGIWWYILLEGDIFGIDRETIDLMISAEVRRTFPMIALGQPGEKLGAGRLSSDNSEWENLILLLIDQATVVFMIPSTSKGVIWEIENLKDHYEKTIYIMPPAEHYYDDAKEYWSITRQELIKHNISLPEYDSKGALFMLDWKGRISRSVPFNNSFGSSNVYDLIRQIL